MGGENLFGGIAVPDWAKDAAGNKRSWMDVAEELEAQVAELGQQIGGEIQQPPEPGRMVSVDVDPSVDPTAIAEAPSATEKIDKMLEIADLSIAEAREFL